MLVHKQEYICQRNNWLDGWWTAERVARATRRGATQVLLLSFLLSGQHHPGIEPVRQVGGSEEDVEKGRKG